MRGLNEGVLQYLLPSGNAWDEDNRTLVQRSTESWSTVGGSKVLNIKIDGRVPNVMNAIAYILGYSEVLPKFNPGNTAAQGPYSLSRKPPARHPIYPNLRATKILSATGEGNAGNLYENSGAIRAGPGVAGEYAFVYLSILFEIPRYEIRSDDENATINGLLTGAQSPLASHGGAGIALPEYCRHTEWDYEANVETLARKGTTWVYKSTRAIQSPPPAWTANTTYGNGDTVLFGVPGITATSIYRSLQGNNTNHSPFNGAPWWAFQQQKNVTGDRMVRQAKGKLKVTWYDVAQDWLMLGRIVPSNFYRTIGTVNSRPFPRVAYRDQTVQQGLQDSHGNDISSVQFRPGTCLLLPPKIKASAQCHPAVLSEQIDASYFPRTMNVEIEMIIFDPPTDDDTTVNLSAASLGGGSATTKVRGHQLTPLPAPSPTGYAFYFSYATIQSPPEPFNPGTSDAPGVPGAGPSQTLYPYSDFEAIFGPPQSLPRD